MNFTKTLTKTGPLKQHWCIFRRRPCLSRSWCYITFNQPNSGSGFRTKHHRSLAVISSKSAKDLSSKWPCWKKQQTLRWRRNNSAHTYGAKVTECLEFKDETSRSLPGLPGRRWQKEWKSLFAIKTTDWTLDHVLTIWTSENRRPLSFECRCKAGHIVAKGQRHKILADWSLRIDTVETNSWMDIDPNLGTIYQKAKQIDHIIKTIPCEWARS